MLDAWCTFFLQTNLETFRSWLENHTQLAYRHHFPTERGRYSLQRARVSRAYNGGCVIGMDTHYIVPGDEPDSETVYRVGNLIEFDLQPLSTNRTEVQAKCGHPVVAAYFVSMLEAISLRWPEAASGIDSVLPRSDENPPDKKQQNEAIAVDPTAQEHQGANGDGTQGPWVEPKQGAKGEPWKAIDSAREQEMVKLWWEGQDKGQIAKKFSLELKTTENLFSLLRRSHGEHVVPLAKDPRRLQFKNRE